MLQVYFDICALKRPWDNQDQVRVAAETHAMVTLMRLFHEGKLRPLRSPAHDAENALNRDPQRAAIVGEWLQGLDLPVRMSAALPLRARELAKGGLSAFDALHLAWAEALAADVLVTTDDRFRRRASRSLLECRVRLMTPVELLREVVE